MKLNYLKDIVKDKADKKRRRKIQLMFSATVFLILFITYLLVMAALYILVETEMIKIETMNIPEWFLVLIFSSSSIILGAVLTFLIGKYVLNAVNTVADGMSALSKGNFDVRIDLGKNEESKQIATSFNNLAKELKGIQVLRSNFVNEYAHEFKTPIASIKGFAELLKEQDLTQEQRKEYLDVIIEEANRLTTLSSNSLNLSRIENQQILTEKTKYNLSEQIRNSILLLETKWQIKNINFQLLFDEYYITADEEMLKQVWINLIDNAIKFSECNSIVDINIVEKEQNIIFTIQNNGSVIKEEDYQKIFEKFYRASETQTSGHGVGLAIVKKIVELHNGTIQVTSKDNLTKFTVTLPCK